MRILFHGPNAANFLPGFESILGEAHDIEVVPDKVESAADRALFAAAEVIVGVRLAQDDPAPANVRLYHAPAAGIDAVDTSCLPAGAALCNAFGHEHAIAEYVMTALLTRHVPIARADQRLRDGRWDYWAGRPGALRTELGDQTIGLLGYGHIGKAIAERAKAFGMRVTACNRSPVAGDPRIDQAYGLDALAAFMGSADAVVVSLPLTDQTRGIVDAAALAAMRPHGVILNVGRGPVIDEHALFAALSGKSIGGAVIDTWYRYPTADQPETQPSRLPFASLANVVMTPHMSGWTSGTVRRRQETIADNIRRLSRGEALLNRVR
jgi:phosphoglycerate dehydrogenase-like enzyme